MSKARIALYYEREKNTDEHLQKINATVIEVMRKSGHFHVSEDDEPTFFRYADIGDERLERNGANYCDGETSSVSAEYLRVFLTAHIEFLSLDREPDDAFLGSRPPVGCPWWLPRYILADTALLRAGFTEYNEMNVKNLEYPN